MRHLLFLLGVMSVGPAAPALGGAVDEQGLGLPLTCTLGRTCWVANYMDGKEITYDAIRSVAVR